MTTDKSIDQAIVEHIVPQLYVAIDDLLEHAEKAPKELIIRAKKLLPSWCPNSFEQKPLKNVKS